MYQKDFVRFHLRKPKVGRKQPWIKTYRYFQSDLMLVHKIRIHKNSDFHAG